MITPEAPQWCRYCGVAPDADAQWWPSPLVCPGCREERGEGEYAYASWRARAASACAALPAWHPAAAQALGFLWYIETPGVQPSSERFAYVDRDALRRRAEQLGMDRRPTWATQPPQETTRR